MDEAGQLYMWGVSRNSVSETERPFAFDDQGCVDAWVPCAVQGLDRVSLKSGLVWSSLIIACMHGGERESFIQSKGLSQEVNPLIQLQEVDGVPGTTNPTCCLVVRGPARATTCWQG